MRETLLIFFTNVFIFFNLRITFSRISGKKEKELQLERELLKKQNILSFPEQNPLIENRTFPKGMRKTEGKTPIKIY